MRVLLLGGTAFVGRHATEAFLARGHQVTLFHRGLTGPDLFPEAEQLIGDRERDTGRLAGARFDVVVDTSASRAGPGGTGRPHRRAARL